MRPVNKVIVHHSASPITTTAEDIYDWHIARGWSGIGYHYIIQADGMIQDGRIIEKTGAHTKGQNTGSVGICLIGNFEEMEPTEIQLSTLKALCRGLLLRFNLEWDAVYAHNDFSATLCCGKNLIPFVHRMKTIKDNTSVTFPNA